MEQQNGTLIRINPRDSEVPAGGISIPLGGAGRAAPDSRRNWSMIMHSLEYITKINNGIKRQPHPLRLHPRIYALRKSIKGMGVSSEYVSRLYASLYKYADQIIERPEYQPEEGWDDFEALQQVTLGDWVEESILRYAADDGRNNGIR